MYQFLAAMILSLPPASTPDVVVNAKKATPSLDSTATETVLENKDGEEASDLGELLQRAPGVQIRRSGGAGARQSVLMRGTDSQQSLVLLDGVRLNPAFGGGVDLSTLSLEGIDRIEVYRGGGAALHGSDALGGVIRIVPRQPSPGLKLRLYDEFGSFGTHNQSASISWGNKDGSLGVIVTESIATSDNNFRFVDTNGQSRIREHAASSRNSFMFIGGYNPRKQSRLRTMGEYTRVSNELPGIEQFPSTSATHERVRGIASLKYEEKGLGVPGLSIESRFSFRILQSHLIDPAPQLPPPADTLATTRGVESDLGLIWDLPGGHRLRLKGSAVADFGEVERTTSDGIISFPSRQLGSVLAADEWMLWDGELTIQSALRTDFSGKYGATIVPRLGAAWDAPLSYPWRLTLKGGLGRSWRHPSFDELYFDTGLVKGNSELNSEDAWSFDTAIKLSYKRLSFQVAAYHLMIDNLILFLPTTAFTMQATDAQGARTTGIESRLSYHPFTSLYFDLRYTYMNARFRDSGMQLPGRSPHVYGARVRFRKKGLLLWFAMEGQSAFFMDRFEGIEEESRIFYDLGVTASVGPHVSFGVVMKNLTDVRTSVDAMQQPLPGLSVLGNVRIKH